MVNVQNSLQTGRSPENLSFLPVMKECPKRANQTVLSCQNLKVVCIYTSLSYSPTVHIQLSNEKIIKKDRDVVAIWLGIQSNNSLNKGHILLSCTTKHQAGMVASWCQGPRRLSTCSTYPRGLPCKVIPPRLHSRQNSKEKKNKEEWWIWDRQFKCTSIVSLCSPCMGQHSANGQSQLSGRLGNRATGPAENGWF